MKFLIFSTAAFALAFINCPAKASAAELDDIMSLASDAFRAEDWDALNTHLDAAQELRAYSLYLWRNRILARVMAGREDEALALAETAARRGLVLNLSGHEAFDILTALPAYSPIAARMESNAAPIGQARIERQDEQTALLPEALAYDKQQNIFVGSVRTGAILKFEGKKAPKLFTTATGGVFDIEPRGKTLWAVVNNQLAFESADPEAPFASVMAFHSKTGVIKREIRVAEENALLGDLEVAKDGTIYATDSTTPRIFRMEPKGQTLDVYVEDSRFANLQGIALDEKNDRLFVADYLTGLFVIDTNTGAVHELNNTADAHLGGTDGLYLYEGDLIGIQNGTSPRRIVYIGLNDDASSITSFISMQQSLEEWNEPTHGVVVDDEFRYIATSNWPSYDENWNVREGAELQPLRIMTLPLKQ
ncbi:hypothetical protein PUV54_15540 [Hyphococcus flavus]|uniref:SMP-30/Gluconolactonase/LRE-like region domain-containing protein n=1 Tax=Hyphococcus flavus TaxID=1866326 RepID=A0AAF0CH09_9PROT|nr:hypothetical protein [Hyphococcus flavus]WDI31362.1 hypothetical protein PUV54_15540 [Hyphococcus flavus]